MHMCFCKLLPARGYFQTSSSPSPGRTKSDLITSFKFLQSKVCICYVNVFLIDFRAFFLYERNHRSDIHTTNTSPIHCHLWNFGQTQLWDFYMKFLLLESEPTPPSVFHDILREKGFCSTPRYMLNFLKFHPVIFAKLLKSKFWSQLWFVFV